jgi:hypothetical protein
MGHGGRVRPFDAQPYYKVLTVSYFEVCRIQGRSFDVLVKEAPNRCDS